MKKIGLLGLLFFSFVVIFSSCIKKQNPQTNIPLEKIELVFWNVFDDSDVFQGPIQAYQSLNPQVNITYKKFNIVDEYEKLLVNEIAEGEGPDILAIKNTWIDTHFKKFTPFPVGRTKVPMNPQIFEETFFYTAAQDLIREGQIYAIPLYIDTLALFYNKQIFRNNIPNSDKPAETWEEIKTQVSMITKENNSLERFAISGIALGRHDNIVHANDIFYALMLEHQVNMFNELFNQAIFASQQGTKNEGEPYYPLVDSLLLYSSFANSRYKNYCWNDAITSMDKHTKELNPFIRGKVAMIFGYSYLYEDLLALREQLKKEGESVINETEIGVVEFPQINSFAETGTRNAFPMYFPLTVSRNSQYPDIAWDFIQYLASYDSLKNYYEKTHKPTSRKDMVDEQMIDPIYGIFARQASYASSFPNKFPLSESFLNLVFQEVIEKAVKNKQNLIDIVKNAQKKVNCQLDKIKNLGEKEFNCLNLDSKD